MSRKLRLSSACGPTAQAEPARARSERRVLVLVATLAIPVQARRVVGGFEPLSLQSPRSLSRRTRQLRRQMEAALELQDCRSGLLNVRSAQQSVLGLAEKYVVGVVRHAAVGGVQQ